MAVLLDTVAHGGRVPDEPWIETVPAPAPHLAAVVAFPGHIVVAADVPHDWTLAHLPDDDLAAPLTPPFLTALERHLGRRVNNIDQVLVASSLSGPPPVPLTQIQDQNHPRVRRALRYRDAVRVWSAPGGVLVLGRGLLGRWELAMEVDPAARNAGLGRRLVTAARHLVPPGEHVWAQVAPGNASSVRAVLAAGFLPVAAEALLYAPVADGWTPAVRPLVGGPHPS